MARRAVYALILGVFVSGAAMGDPFMMEIRPTTVAVDWSGTLLMRYLYDEVPYKPYVIEFFSPSGINPLMDGPDDHKHHHALMYAVKVNGVNFWEEAEAPGREQHVSFSVFDQDQASGLDRARVVEALQWQDSKDNTPLLEETRAITVYRGKDLNHSLMNWQTTFAPPRGVEKAELTGSHYHGLGVRFHDSMVFEGKFSNAADSEGEVVRGSEKLTRATWCAYQGRAEGAPVTWAMFDHPKNPRHPAYWFTMYDPFAYMSATLNLHREPLEVTQSQPLVLTYGVALWDGHVSKDEIEKAYQHWLSLGP